MPNWTAEQSLAINKSGTNIIVSAGAGSGKTAVLTERVITKIKNGVNIQELLILTFTNAAAHEMKERIGEALKSSGFTEQLKLIDTAYITTFDSYSLSIVKKYHYLLNINKDINIIDNTFIEMKEKEFLNEIFEEYYKNRDEDFISLIKDFCVKDDLEIRKCLLAIYKKIAYIENKEEYLENYIENHYNNDYIKVSFKDYLNLLKRKIKSLDKLGKAISYEVDGDFYTKLCFVVNPLLSSATYEEIQNNANIKLPILRNATEMAKKIKDQMNQIINDIKSLTEKSEADLKEEYVDSSKYVKVIIKILLRLEEKVNGFKNNINYYEFSDIAFMATKILKDNPSIREELKNSYKEIMIDEYQDTNNLQEYFISLIANNNVYMVGDIKQSIYRFRNANPDLFKTKYDNYKNNLGGEKIDLNKNFRSRKEILNDINIMFDCVMDDYIGGAEYKISHEMIFGNMVYENEGKTKQNNKLEIYNYHFETGKGLSRDEVEAFIIANDIKKKIDSGYKIYDKNLKTLRPVQYKDFVILMDRSKSFDTYKKIGEYLGLPVMPLKDDNILEEIEIALFKNYFKLIYKINKREFDQVFKYSFVSVARSYLYNLNDNDIYWYLENNNYKDSIVFKDSKELASDLEKKSILEILDSIVDKCDFFHKIIGTTNIKHKRLILDYLRKLIKDLSNLGYDLLGICDYLDQVENDIGEIKIPSFNDDSNAIKIMTIFKSKGLEFPICYVSSLYSEFNIRELSNLFFLDSKYGFVSAIFKDGIAGTYITELTKNKYMRENISERIRLFYVALTRCKEKMILLADMDLEEEEELVKDVVSDEVRLKYKRFNDILVSIKENIKEYIHNVDLNKIPMNKEYLQTKVKDYKTLVENEEVINIKQIDISKEIVEQKHFSKEIKELYKASEIEKMDFGTYIHSVLENVNWQNPDVENIDVSEEFKNSIRYLLKQDVFKNIDKAKIYPEYEFIYKDKGREYHGIIDLLIVYEDHVDIIDYKLNNIDDKKYIEQLKGYQNFIHDYLKKDVNIYLYSILQNILKKI